MDVNKDNGLTHFQQSVYAVETFIKRRIALGLFKTDKYFLYGLENSNIEIDQFASKFESLFDSLDPNKSVAAKESKPEKEKKCSSRLYSGWEHPYKHFYQQLLNQKCRNTPNTKSSVAAGLWEIMAQVNSKRMYSGADMRFFGNLLNKIEPCNVILFTQSRIENTESFWDLKPESSRYVNN